MRILSIDPGLANTGWSIVQPFSADKYEVVDSGTIVTAKNLDITERLMRISDALLDTAIKYEAAHAAAEDIFFTNNITSGISVAKVIGSFSYAFSKNGISLNLFTPTEIKLCVTGGGKSDKKAVKLMVMRQVVSPKELKTDHEIDSIACAITFFVMLKKEMLLGRA